MGSFSLFSLQCPEIFVVINSSHHDWRWPTTHPFLWQKAIPSSLAVKRIKGNRCVKCVCISLSGVRWCWRPAFLLQLMNNSAAQPALSWCSLTHQHLNCCPDALCTCAKLTHSLCSRALACIIPLHYSLPSLPPSGALWLAQPAALLRVRTWVRVSAWTQGCRSYPNKLFRALYLLSLL